MSPSVIDPAESALIPKFLQIPYLHRGRSFEGTDCWGLIILWYKWRLGIDIFDVEEDYPPHLPWADRMHFVEHYYRNWEKCGRPEKYDVVLFKMEDRFHAGVFLRDDKFIHIGRSGCVIARLSSPVWAGRLDGFYRLKNDDQS